MDELNQETYQADGGRATPEQMARKHVYVVNGSPQFLDIVRQLLQDEHYNVTTTNFVPRSFETIESAQPTLLIIDLVVGEQAGWDLLARLRRGATTRGIPVLLVSTTPRLLHEAHDRYREFSSDHFLLKPFDLDDLLLTIEDMIGTAQCPPGSPRKNKNERHDSYVIREPLSLIESDRTNDSAPLAWCVRLRPQ
jgi:two-component system alkaline phosphatase synthesis response regulator PhoP